MYIDRHIYGQVFPFQLTDNPNGLLRVILDYDEQIQSYPGSNQLKLFPIMESMIAGIIGIVLCSTVFIVYIRRKSAQQIIEIVERTIFLRKIKKVLIKRQLYIEYSNIQLKAKLGDGNFGEVYRANVQRIDSDRIEEVAIKKLKRGMLKFD